MGIQHFIQASTLNSLAKEAKEKNMTLKSHHVVPHPQGWCIKVSGEERVLACFPTQAEAIATARQICINQGTELFIHNRQGQFRERNSYGNDPFPPKG